jgi:hypothetical protein
VKKRDRETLALALLAFAAWQAYRARVAAEQAAILAASADDFDVTSWTDWKNAVRNVTVTKVIEQAGRIALKRIKP